MPGPLIFWSMFFRLGARELGFPSRDSGPGSAESGLGTRVCRVGTRVSVCRVGIRDLGLPSRYSGPGYAESGLGTWVCRDKVHVHIRLAVSFMLFVLVTGIMNRGKRPLSELDTTCNAETQNADNLPGTLFTLAVMSLDLHV